MSSALGSNYLILFFVFFSLLCGSFYIFYANPYHILNIARVPMMILTIAVVLGFLIFIEYYMAHIMFKGDTSRELWTNFLNYCKKYAIYLFYILSIALITYFIFKMVEKGFYFSFTYSFWTTMGLLIIVLALINSFTKKVEFNNTSVELFRNFIMYIPCLITDLIDFVKKDYENTPSTVFIVFLVLIVYICVFYFIPFYRKKQYKNDGILLVEKAAPLKTDILSISSESLNEKIHNHRPFYDRWFQTMIAQQTQKTRSDVDIRGPSKKDISLNVVVPPDTITLPYYIRRMENFTSIQNEDSNAVQNIIPYHLLKNRIKEYYSLDDAYSPEEYKERMRQFISEHPQILTVLEKAQYLYSGAFASWDTVKSIPYFMFGNKSKVPTYSYHYAITCWVYLQQIDSTKMQHIYSFGTRPSLYYDPLDSTLFIALDYGTPRQKIIYKTSAVLYQRWNFIVMNYRYGTLDVFINNNLVGTYPDVLTYLDPHDILLVGSKNNENIGGICNMKYYELPLNVRKINDIYKTFHNKKIPV